MTKLVAGYSQAGSGEGTLAPWDEIFDRAECLNTRGSKPLKELDGLLLWGGEDISPSLYNQKVSRSYAQAIPSYRDKFEWELLREAVLNNIPIIAVCRGAQLVTAFAGGSLIQHVDNHNGNHVLVTYDGEEFDANSYHHQMMNPYDLPKEDYQLLAWTKEAKATTYIGEGHKQVVLNDGVEFKSMCEPEVVFYPKLKALCIQGHPEWLKKDHVFVQWCITEAKRLLFSETSLYGTECPI